MIILPVGHIRAVLKSKNNITVMVNGLHCSSSRQSVNIKGKDCIIYLAQRLAGMDKCMEKSHMQRAEYLVGPLPSFTQSISVAGILYMGEVCVPMLV